EIMSRTALVATPIVAAAALLAVSCTSSTKPDASGADAPRKTGSIAGRISQPDSTPETGAHVVAGVRQRDGSILPFGSTMAAWDGRYEIDGLPAGEYLVLAEPDPTAKVERLNRHIPP